MTGVVCGATSIADATCTRAAMREGGDVQLGELHDADEPTVLGREHFT